MLHTRIISEHNIELVVLVCVLIEYVCVLDKTLVSLLVLMHYSIKLIMPVASINLKKSATDILLIFVEIAYNFTFSVLF